LNSLEYLLVSKQKLDLVEKRLEWPPVSGEGILCKTLITGISPGTELAAWRGESPLRPSGGFPRKMGYQNISEVIAIVGNIEGVKLGDMIYTNQSHCSSFVATKDEVLAIVPRYGSVKEYIFSYMYHMSFCALTVDDWDTPYKENRLLLFGGGVLGTTIAEIASSLDYDVVLVSDSMGSSKFRESKIKVISRDDFRTALDRELQGFPRSVLCTSRWDDYHLSLERLGNNGTMVVLGFPGRDGSLPLQNPFEPRFFYLNNLVVRSLPSCRSLSLDRDSKRMTLSESMADIVGRISRNELGQAFALSETMTFNDLPAAYSRLSQNRGETLSLSLTW
jgi:NADPH:quinone reductase-like Zn-dependent oxidoreductase